MANKFSVKETWDGRYLFQPVEYNGKQYTVIINLRQVVEVCYWHYEIYDYEDYIESKNIFARLMLSCYAGNTKNTGISMEGEPEKVDNIHTVRTYAKQIMTAVFTDFDLILKENEKEIQTRKESESWDGVVRLPENKEKY